ncbi:enoyl-CoA hydratase-related protein [Amycolatopsis pigmentata]|uniref:Enoyl-CoA hydratase-related protein n=1 Tax=Amycolatopsis pigmentata TaxID=450801 RepID=A0ABW5G139_9PSEU
MAGEELVRREDDGGVATLWLSRGPRNALDAELLAALVEAMAGADADPDIGALVLTGNGRTFSVGADLSTGPTAVRDLMAGLGGYGGKEFREPAGRTTLRMAALSVPVIAAVNGDAIGGGATVLLAADVRFAADSARFGFPFTRLGLCPEGASTFFLPRLVGASRASDWLLSGRLIDAAEALSAGLVSRVLPAGEVLAEAQTYAREMVAHTSPSAVAATKALLAAGPADPRTASDAESRTIAELAAAPDGLEGVAAFLDRRPPRFRKRNVARPSNGVPATPA